LVFSPTVIDQATVAGGPPMQTDVALTSNGAGVSWTVTESIPWLTLSPSGGTTPGTLHLTLDPSGLAVGSYTGVLSFNAGGAGFTMPVTFRVVPVNVTQMAADLDRPYIYAINRGSGTSADSFLLFINTQTAHLDKAIPIGTNPTDLPIHYAEKRLYVSDWQHAPTHVVDLLTQQELAPLSLGTSVYELNAGRPGRLVTENGFLANRVYLVDTGTGAIVGQLPRQLWQGIRAAPPPARR